MQLPVSMATTADVWALWADSEQAMSTKRSTTGENDFGYSRPKENTLNTCCDWLCAA